MFDISKNKNSYIRVRLTEEEKKIIKNKSQEKYKNISDYIRALIKNDIEKKGDNK